MEAGPELDEIMHTRVMGLPKAVLGGACPHCGEKTYLTKDRAWCTGCREWIYSPYPEYSEMVEWAWQVRNKIAELCIISIQNETTDGSSCFVRRKGEDKYIAVEYGETAPLAICNVALKVMELESEHA